MTANPMNNNLKDSAKSRVGANLIYHNYGGLADEIVDSDNGVIADSGTVSAEAEKTKLMVKSRQEQEARQEQQKTDAFFANYEILTTDKQKEVVQRQKTAEQIIGRYLKDEKDIQGLSQEERFILNKIKNEYRDFKKNNPNKIFSFDLANSLDKAIYSNLVYDISFRVAGLASPIKRVAKAVSKNVSGKTELKKENQTIFEPTLVEIAPRTLGELEADSQAKVLTIEYLRQKENILTQADAEELVGVIRDWFYYGGDLYKHWTGRIIKLRRGVDYQVNSEGQPDEGSYATAVNSRVEEWLKQPVNRNWIAEANAFKKENESTISFQKQVVEFKDAKNNVFSEERYTTPYHCEDGWLFYESNYYDTNLSAMTQRQREPSKYSIYFNVENQDIMRVYLDIIYKLSADEELSKVGFAINTIAMFSPTVEIVSEAMNQKDKIVLFVGDRGINQALRLIQDYVQKNRAKFGKRGILLSQKFFDREGKEVPGVSVASNVKGVSPDASRGFPKYKSFNSMQVEIIQSALNSIFKEIYNFDNLDKIGFTNPDLRDQLLEIGHDGSLRDYLPLFLSQQSGVNFLIKNLVRFYPKWSRAFGMSAHNIAFREEEKQ